MFRIVARVVPVSCPVVVVSSRLFPWCSFSCRPPPASTLPPLVSLVTCESFIVPLPLSVRDRSLPAVVVFFFSGVARHFTLGMRSRSAMRRVSARGAWVLPTPVVMVVYTVVPPRRAREFDFVVRPLASLGRSCTSARPSVLPLRFPPVSRRRSVVAG